MTLSNRKSKPRTEWLGRPLPEHSGLGGLCDAIDNEMAAGTETVLEAPDKVLPPLVEFLKEGLGVK